MKDKTVEDISETIEDEKIKQRVQIESVQPKINGGRFPVKRIVEDTVKVEADIFVDGNNELSAVLLYREEDHSKWTETPMEHSVNDRWVGEFKVSEIGQWKYSICAWIDHFKSWQRDFKKRVEAEQNVEIDILIGLELINSALKKASTRDKEKLNNIIGKLSNKRNKAEANKAALSDELKKIMAKYPDRANAVTYRELTVIVDPKIARFSAWYEMFPRSAGSIPGKHGTFKDVISRLPYIADMGFSVLYLPPVHPVGLQFRKGKNNSVNAEKGAVGSPWAIGSKEGGHYAINPQLGTLKDFQELIREAGKLGISIALDIAYQCSPDHPYVTEHPEWFRKRPDNTIQYAENPPKKYQDIYPLDFETADWQGLWDELKNIVIYWIKQDVKIFRVDNPHTKDLSFWEWMISGIKKEYPEVIFLSEAFTRPKLLYRLAKLGFSQSYNYFPWRNTKWELTEFITELTKTEAKEFFRANLWTNTPDILTEYLQVGGQNAFKIRFILAATLGANYGIYGPAFELCVNRPLGVNSEEYLDSEKYEIKLWKRDGTESLRPLITKINQIRNDNEALQYDDNLEFYPIDNDSLLCYGKHSPDFSEILIIIVNLDPRWAQSGWVELPLSKFGIGDKKPYQVQDLLTGVRYLWNGPRNFVKLDPSKACAHIFRVRRYHHTEKSFDYYL
ncbi:MAG: alpha-1,4-glucan--maltose-1-phosphate maltosyltransferase [Elusimicrobia bacterium]|nr:alpha-1,4-glucan--maltose-1-phosphate maltosyltransferase [Candidatus Liberimonas magnetica]